VNCVARLVDSQNCQPHMAKVSQSQAECAYPLKPNRTTCGGFVKTAALQQS
jgi:hypothetical protein